MTAAGHAIPRYTDEQIVEMCKTMTDEEVAEATGYYIERVRFKRRRGGVVRDPNETRRVSQEDRDWIAEKWAESWPASEVVATRPHLNRDYVLRHFPFGRAGNEYAAVKRWANRHHAELFASIQRMDI